MFESLKQYTAGAKKTGWRVGVYVDMDAGGVELIELDELHEERDRAVQVAGMICNEGFVYPGLKTEADRYDFYGPTRVLKAKVYVVD